MDATGTARSATLGMLLALLTLPSHAQSDAHGVDLDERIQDPSKITEIDPAPLPSEVILPLPPDHRLAPSHMDVGIDGLRWQKARAAIEHGLAYLRSTHDTQSGGWMTGARAAPTDDPDRPAPVSVAVTALIVKAFVQNNIDPNRDEAISRALDYVVLAQREDGSFIGGGLTNYVTSSVVSALAAVDDDDLGDRLHTAVNWLQSGQWDEKHGLNPRQDWYGGAGYGNNGRPDLSNTQMMLDALYDAGLSPDEPVFQKAVQFLSRAQNLQATNKAKWAGNDGGFIYTPASGGESMASEVAGEGRHGEKIPAGEPRSLRSYGSMTYAGFKSLLYAGLSQDDVRVRAAYDWIRRHFTFDENPGVGPQGLYYYYHAMARALRIAQQDVIIDEEGNEHNWRAELIDAILERQRPDGSWINEHDRWMEGDADLVTAYAILALQEALK